MTVSIDERPRVRRRFRLSAAIFAATIAVAGLSAAVLVSGTSLASATTVSFSQCNNRNAGPGGAPLSVTCSITIVNTIDANGGSSAVVYLRTCTLNACIGDTTSSSDVINAVHQCNGSDNVGGSTTICSVHIVNNISTSTPSASTALTLDQCNGSGGGAGTDMTACIPQSDASPTVTQCDGSGTGGGGMMTCTASGTDNVLFPVTVDQCNGSENGGGSFVTCTTTITNNVIFTGTGGTPVGGTPVGGTPVAGTPVGGTPVGGTPVGGTPVAGTPLAPPGTDTPGVPGSPTAPPPVVTPPSFTG